MLAAPYTKWHCSQWNVDQAAAFLLCSAEAADRAGVPRDRRVFPLAAVESNHMVPVSRRADLHRAPAVRIGGERLARGERHRPRHGRPRRPLQLLPVGGARAGGGARASTTAAVRSPSTGGMTFGGGPLNNAILQALAKLVDGAPRRPGTTGLVTSISGMITKHGRSLWSTTPPADGFVADVSHDAAAATAALDLVDDYRAPRWSTATRSRTSAATLCRRTSWPRPPTAARVAARCDDRGRGRRDGDRGVGRPRDHGHRHHLQALTFSTKLVSGWRGARARARGWPRRRRGARRRWSPSGGWRRAAGAAASPLTRR